jgi:hypothetical protein
MVWYVHGGRKEGKENERQQEIFLWYGMCMGGEKKVRKTNDSKEPYPLTLTLRLRKNPNPTLKNKAMRSRFLAWGEKGESFFYGKVCAWGEKRR